MEEVKKQLYTDTEHKPYGRSIRPPIEVCARNLERAMYPLMLQLCYYCQKSSSERDVFETNSGKIFFNIQLCARCVEYNRASQQAGTRVLLKYKAQEQEDKTNSTTEKL